MKKLLSFLSVLFLLLNLVIISSCGNKKSADGIGENDIILLNELQVTGLIASLPDVMDFNAEYQARLSEAEKASPDINDLFFKALAKSDLIRKSYTIHGFKDSGEFIQVYKSVVLAYTTIKQDLTNYDKDIKALDDTVNQQGTGVDKILYSNILLVKQYEKQIDAESTSNR